MNLELNKVHLGDSLEVLKLLPDNSIDSCVCDPPYGIRFMNRKWDYNLPSVELWQEVLRLLKPGAHALVACGTRTQHRMAVNLEDAGFEIRDVISWVYGEGFPKNHNVGKAVDKLCGNQRETVGTLSPSANSVKSNIKMNCSADNVEIITKGNSQWEGWGTALKPATEFFTLVRKPLSEKSIAKNVLKRGTGAINIDDCRVDTTDNLGRMVTPQQSKTSYSMHNKKDYYDNSKGKGRFPANLIHDGSDEVLEGFPNTKGDSPNRKPRKSGSGINTYTIGKDFLSPDSTRTDFGSASRYFYCAKASKAERGASNNHPTVKPIKLMSYLCRLITPPDGVCIDPFLGSGTTAIACIDEGFNYIGIEKEPEYHAIAIERIKNHLQSKPQKETPDREQLSFL